MRKLVYICSPCRGDYETNIENAETYSRFAFRNGFLPVTPHIYFTRFLDDRDPKQRADGMEAGTQLLLSCSELWVFGIDKPTEGMQAEIAAAVRNGIPIRDGLQLMKDGANAQAERLIVTIRRETP